MKTLAEQLRQAVLDHGLSMPQVIEQAGLACTPSSLSRKLNGLQKLSTDEAQSLANVLRTTLVWKPQRAA